MRRLLGLLAMAMADAGGLSRPGVLIRQLQARAGTGGVVNVSTTAAVFGSATVTHGFAGGKRTPNRAFATAVSNNGVVNATIANLGSTTVDIFIRYTDDVARTTTVAVYWKVES
jgi:fructose-1-phosphate kinase PfkB-like protein